MKYLRLSIISVLLLIFGLYFSACVSVKIADKSAKKSDRFEYESPDSGFKYIKDDAVDVAWLKKDTGSTLSVRSKCKKGLDLDLEDWLTELSESLSSGEKIKFNKIRFNNRKALQTVLNSDIEGYNNKLAITTFVKNSCHYIIALTTLSANFDTDLQYYNSFLAGFRAW